MEPAATTKVKTFTFKARLYDTTPLGEFFVGKVEVTIDFGDVNERALSSRFVLKEMEEMDNLPPFSIMDFPAEADTPSIDIQSNLPTSDVPVDIINSVNIYTSSIRSNERIQQATKPWGSKSRTKWLL